MEQPTTDIAPIIGPVLSLMRSRKFIVAVITLIVDVVVAYVPTLEPVRTELLSVFTAIGVALVASIAYEDAAAG